MPPAPGTPGARFVHGVASGDPSPTGVVLWTRITPGDPAQTEPIRLVVQVWPWDSGRGATDVVGTAYGNAGPERDWTVKIDLDRDEAFNALEPGRDYAFQFRIAAGEADQVSSVGRFRTLPAEDSAEEVVLAVASCSLHPGGWFNAYQAIAELERVDAVVHLGDYIYEYGAGERDYGMRTGLELNRIPEPPHEIVTLDDYRRRHAQYKTDRQAQAAHARAAWIMTFDDHEVTNDPWEGGAQNHNADEGDWSARKAAALTAYLEWNPIREPQSGVPLHDTVRRSFRFGRTAALHMVETRLSARSRQLEYEDITAPDGTIDRTRLEDPARQLMGAAQLDWLGDSMANGATWQVLGNQVLMARLVVPDLVAAVGRAAIEAAMPGLADYQQRRLREMADLGAAQAPLNLDAWDGYPAERARLYAKVRQADARLIVLTGDSHAAWASNLHDVQGQVGVEFGGTAISSPQPSYSRALPGAPMAELTVAASPDLQWCEFEPRGFFVLSLTPQRAQCRMMGVSSILSPDFSTDERARFTVPARTSGLGPLERR
ncbi:MAG: alkaline phosphatase D family protein [Caulobacterales bacterium]|nr:alkaline phosphatase D family protein [Caulobacterales bacterium]